MKESAPASPLPRDRARSLRASQTDAERKLWSRLRAHRMHGAKFRRQHPIGPYIADFFCQSARLIIELDGGGHDSEEQRRKDRDRTDYLVRCGYLVLRFWNTEIAENLEGVMQEIATRIKGPSPGASRPPLPIGRG